MALECKYRFVVSGKEQLQKITFASVDKIEDGIFLHSFLTFSEEDKYAFDLRIASSAKECDGKTFSGVAFRWEPVSKVPWAVEIVMDIPLNVKSWNVFVQDLYTKYKQVKINNKWAGIDHNNWQGARSPLEFAATDGMMLWGRLGTLNKMFSSKAIYDKKKGPLFSYNFTFDSESQKNGPEFSFLLARDKNDHL